MLIYDGGYIVENGSENSIQELEEKRKDLSPIKITLWLGRIMVRFKVVIEEETC